MTRQAQVLFCTDGEIYKNHRNSILEISNALEYNKWPVKHKFCFALTVKYSKTKETSETLLGCQLGKLENNYERGRQKIGWQTWIRSIHQVVSSPSGTNSVLHWRSNIQKHRNSILPFGIKTNVTWNLYALEYNICPVKHKFCFALTVKYSKTIKTRVSPFWDVSWANWVFPRTSKKTQTHVCINIKRPTHAHLPIILNIHISI